MSADACAYRHLGVKDEGRLTPPGDSCRDLRHTWCLGLFEPRSLVDCAHHLTWLAFRHGLQYVVDDLPRPPSQSTMPMEQKDELRQYSAPFLRFIKSIPEVADHVVVGADRELTAGQECIGADRSSPPARLLVRRAPGRSRPEPGHGKPRYSLDRWIFRRCSRQNSLHILYKY